MALAVVRDLREQRAPAGLEELAEFDVDGENPMVVPDVSGTVEVIVEGGDGTSDAVSLTIE